MTWRGRCRSTANSIPCIYYGSEQKFDGSGAGPGTDFGYPASVGGARILSVLAWSRILAEREVLAR